LLLLLWGPLLLDGSHVLLRLLGHLLLLLDLLQGAHNAVGHRRGVVHRSCQPKVGGGLGFEQIHCSLVIGLCCFQLIQEPAADGVDQRGCMAGARLPHYSKPWHVNHTHLPTCRCFPLKKILTRHWL
jgi:hypothetical protein